MVWATAQGRGKIHALALWGVQSTPLKSVLWIRGLSVFLTQVLEA